MSSTVKLTNFSDFDRLLIGRNFIVTLLGSVLAFSLAYFQYYISIPVIPFNLSLSIGVMIFVAIFTRNIASSMLVAIVGSIGIVSPDGDLVQFFLPYIVINILIMVILGYLADKLQLVMDWTRFYLASAMLFSTIFIIAGIFWNPFVDPYRDLFSSVMIGSGGNLGTGYKIPVLDLAVLTGLLLLILTFAIILRGQILLESKSLGKYRIFGILFYSLGHLVSLVPILLFSLTFSRNQFRYITAENSQIALMHDLFYHDEIYALIGGPVSIFFIMAISFTFSCIGIALLMIHKHGGNLEGANGGSEITVFAAPLAFVFYFGFGSYYFQTIILASHQYMSVELFPMFASVIWGVFYLTALVARILLFVFDRF